MRKLDINCDLGEAYSIYRCGDDAAILPFITSANVACGFQASDPKVMRVVQEDCIRSINGKDVPTKADSICVHSDTPGAVEIAKAVHAAVSQL